MSVSARSSLYFSGNGLDPRTYGDEALAQLAAMFAKGFVEELAVAWPQGIDPILPQLETAWRNSSKADSYILVVVIIGSFVHI